MATPWRLGLTKLASNPVTLSIHAHNALSRTPMRHPISATHAAHSTLMEANTSTARVQALYDAAANCFGANATSDGDEAAMDALKEAMAHVTAADLALPTMDQTQNTPRGWLGALGMGSSGDTNITYLEPNEPIVTNNFTVGIFCLAPGATIPLHDHPGMTVVSRLITGRMQVRSFDWASPDDSPASSYAPRRALEVKPAGTEVREGDIMMLHADEGGNLHEFTALEYTCILDVLAPPYSPSGGRDCTYYSMADDGGGGGGGGGGGDNSYLLEPFTPPSSFDVRRVRYTGVKPTYVTPDM